MPFKRVREILNQAIEFHKLLVDFYHGIEDVTDKASVKLLVDYMARHEKILTEELSQITAEQERQLAEEWIKYEPEYASCGCFEELSIDKDSTVDDVVDAGLKLNQCLIDLCHSMAEIAPTEGVKALFSNLELMEIAEKKKLARTRGM